MEKRIPLPEIPQTDDVTLAKRMIDSQGENCMSWWFPRICDHVPVPKTELVETPGPFVQMFGLIEQDDGPPAWFEDFLASLTEAALRVSAEGPWFLRSGVYSGKHSFRHCCEVTDLSKIAGHVIRIFHDSMLVDLFGLPCNVWAVREWLPGKAICRIEKYGGMPLRREFRAFAANGRVKCIHPYWPPESLELATELDEQVRMMNEMGGDRNRLLSLASVASSRVSGEWSIDLLETDRGWFVTDMALAQRSFHWPDCPRLKREPVA